MDLKISKYRIYLHQFSNVVLGTSVVALLLSMSTAATGLEIWVQQIFIFLMTFLVLFHSWWRNAELFTTGKSKSAGVYSIGIVKIAFILMSILWLKSVSEMTNPQYIHFQIFFGIVNIVLWGGLLQQMIFLKPLYGKERILQKRELLTDLFYALSLTLFLTGFVFLPELVFGVVGFAVFAVIVSLSRPFAKVLTPWTELAPPHRGGRGGRSRRDRSYQGESRPASSQNRHPKRERDFDERRRKRSYGNRSRPSGPGRERSNQMTRPEYKRNEPVNTKVAEQRTQISNPARGTIAANADHDNTIRQKNAANNTSENQKREFGRSRRGRRQQSDRNDKIGVQKNVSESDKNSQGQTTALTKRGSSNFQEPEMREKNVVQYGRKKIRAGQKNRQEKGSDDTSKNQESSKAAAVENSN